MPMFNDATTLEYCLLELVLNSLKAQATAIAIRIHHRDRKIQVIDNGFGISKHSLKYMGDYTRQNKNLTPRDLEKNSFDEGSLVKIQRFSSWIIIMSRSQNTRETYGKYFSNNRVSKLQRIQDRPCSGTTVTVYASKKFCNWGKEINCSTVKLIIVYLSLVNKQVSFSVRDDMQGRILLRIGKYQKRRRLLRVVSQEPIRPGLIQRIKPQIFGRIKISGFWSVGCIWSRKIQQVLVNFRPVHYPLLEKFILKIISKVCYPYTENSNFCLDRIFFLVYIESPESEFTISVKNVEIPEVDFLNTDEILNYIKISITKTETERRKPRTTFGCKSTIPLITTRPMRRMLGASQKRSFLTKVSMHKFQKSTAIAETKESYEIEKLPTVSDYYFSDYVGNVEVHSKNQEIVRQSPKHIETSSTKSRRGETADEFFSAAKKYQYDNHGVLWISQKNNEKISNRVEEIYDVGCSQWSNWTYEPDTGNCVKENRYETNRPVLYKRFKFLPLNLHALLPFLNEKLIKDLSKEVEMPMNLNLLRRPKDFDVRPCVRRSLEFILKNESLKSMKVLNQVNQEFIVALTTQDDRKLVVVVDQHAMHERIRYENLLRAYKRDQKNQQFITITLHRPIIISDLSTSVCNLLFSNEDLLAQYGLRLAFRNATTLLIFGVPRCFLKKTFRSDNVDVEIAIRRLLQEVVENLTTNGAKKFLPFTIHDAIASEACHGSIKFGDPLTLKQCKNLISCWKETDAPNRCAHGRPSVIPLLELSSHRKNASNPVCQIVRRFAEEGKKTKSTTWEMFGYLYEVE